MDKPETSHTLHRIAARMRDEAAATRFPGYRKMMLRTADSLEAEAHHLAQVRASISLRK
jgi:hypothetical protein